MIKMRRLPEARPRVVIMALSEGLKACKELVRNLMKS
jgi:hypothetical protein